ncbi:MAG TPA: diacylglycerol kinase family protein [Polyangiaceae bacterium]|nr:diacylglycerol kinase family protein [Polyangiaceae bacterium]
MIAAPSQHPPTWPAPGISGAGAGLAVMVNANAKRGGRRVAVEIARALPAASVRLTKSPPEIIHWLHSLPPHRAVLAAGGDGSAVALVNALARLADADGRGTSMMTMGILPLGTGNGWAHALGAPKLYRCLELLAQTPGRLPTRLCSLIEVEGTLAHFAGSGWDAMILDDYKRQLDASKGPSRHLSKSVYGYLTATLFRTVPKVAVFGNPRVIIENLGDAIYGVDPAGHPHLLEGVGRGAVIYDGPVGTASVGTCPEFGYRFRAFPFAERMPGFMSVRAYSRGALGAVSTIPRLWSGEHPLRGMHDWLATHVRMTFSRQVPLQVGGDAHGMRRTIEYRASTRCVSMIDWRRMD